MKVLFLGGTGLIGTACGERLLKDPTIELTIVHRGGSPLEYSGANEVIGDVWGDVPGVTDKNWDVIVNWITFGKEQAERDIKRWEGKAGQFVFISSASAYQKPPSHYRITESTPLVNPHWEYSRNKAAIEGMFFNSKIPATVVRPSHTYGRGSIPFPISSNAAWSPVQRILDGKPVIVPGDGTSLWTTTYNTDFAKGFAGLIGQSRAVGQAFHITSDEAVSWNNLVSTVCFALGVEPKLIALPSKIIENKLERERGGLLGDKAESVIFDNSKIKDFVPGFRCKVTFAQGVRKCLKYWETHEKKVDPDFMREQDELLALAEKIYAL